MTLQVTTKINLFIQRMTESDEQAQWGFSLLLKRTDYEEFFDILNEAGLFSPEHNPGPAPADQPGYVHIPFWYALNYLEAVSKVAGERNDHFLADKVMNVVRSVSRAREHDGSIRDNYHTYRMFAEILGNVPISAVSVDDLELITPWLNSKYERGLVGSALDTGIIKKLLASDAPKDWEKACLILQHCTVIRWVDEKGLGDDCKKPVTVVDDYWLKELIQHHASAFGAKAGITAAEIFLDRLRDIFGKQGRQGASCLSRPAIEDHDQNHSWDGPTNCFVEGLRDVLLAWVDQDAPTAKQYILRLLKDEAEIARRIGIYVLNQRWDALGDIYPIVLDPSLFNHGHLHELYGLLNKRFAIFTEVEKAATIEAIRQIPPPDVQDDPEELLKYVQRKWLSAIAGKGFEPADKWYEDIQSDNSLGRLQEHPDFLTYMESWSGPGPSPYSINELISFAEDGSIVERLNAFQQTDSWRGPTARALVDMLVGAVKARPLPFLRVLQQFLNAKRPYQYGIISGFKHIWDEPPIEQIQIDWNNAWESIIGFFESLLEDAGFWNELVVSDRDFTPNRDWVTPVIAEFLRSGTRNDEKVYPEHLLSKAWSLIERMLENLEPESEVREDAMTQAINTSKGKTIEAMYSHALRACRLSDRTQEGHAHTWTQLQPTFDKELNKCKDTNYEFSTLAGAYLANLDYMDHNWLQININQIFPQQFPANFACALEGLAYGPATRPIYSLLNANGIIEQALKSSIKGRHSREKLIERIALAYLWGEEKLDGSIFSILFELGKEDDLIAASSFFWSVSNQDMEENQIERILQYWERCLSWSDASAEAPIKLLSSLSRLSCYIQSVSNREAVLLNAVAPHIQTNYNTHEFIEDLDRLVEKNPKVISAIFQKAIESYKPTYDFQDKIKSLINKFAGCGLLEDAIRFANHLRQINGMQALFDQLVKSKSSSNAV